MYTDMLRHTPVLKDEALEAMPPSPRFVLDGTLGHAGHMQEMIDYFKEQGGELPTLVGVDRDPEMLEKAKEFLGDDAKHVKFVQASYADIETIRQESGVDKFDFILLDIGVNMEHFKDGDRGFSIKREGELDMRYDRTNGMPASEWLAKTNFPEMSELLEAHTDFSPKFRDWFIKELLVNQNKDPFTTTTQLQDWARERKINNKVLAVFFQTLRIAVNDELQQLDIFLQNFPEWLLPKGRSVIISYHSGEDRRVKYAYRDLDAAGKGTVLTKSVIKPNWKEIQRNKAARSAKMRIFETV